MAIKEQKSLPPAVNHLQQRVQKWRQSKKDQFSITPGEFWEAAVPLAVQFGACRIARTVGLDYGGLRKRVAELTDNPSPARSITFVEVPASGKMRAENTAPEPRPDPVPESGLLIDISRPDGARMRISLRPGIDMDAAGIVAAFVGGCN
ncbi:MAG: hypothetical protein IPP78_02125 [Holophagaceae bacterium]|nr:hypothetical protein [Holophagaceae bacterium]